MSCQRRNGFVGPDSGISSVLILPQNRGRQPVGILHPAPDTADGEAHVSKTDNSASQDPLRAYAYSPLPDGKMIRVLTLYGGNPDNPRTGELEFVRVDAAGVYEPLSYVWGDTTLTHKILLPTLELGLTASLYHALIRLRLQTGPRRVWVDQICIDQRNAEERSQQVQFMNRIYEGGSHVQVWLGLDERGLAEKAFSFVRELAELLLNDEDHAAFRIANINNLANQSADDWAPLKSVTALPWVS